MPKEKRASKKKSNLLRPVYISEPIWWYFETSKVEGA